MQCNWSYDIPEIGYNYRITDFQAALGISQLKKLNQFILRRKRLVDYYNKAFYDIDQIQLPTQRSKTSPAYHLYVIRVKDNLRDKLYQHLRKDNILTQINYIPVYRFTAYQKRFKIKHNKYPVSEKYFTEALSLPLYIGLSDAQQKHVIKVVKKFFN